MLETIDQAIATAYGDPDAPRYDFVGDATARALTAAVVALVARSATTTQTSDYNTEVSDFVAIVGTRLVTLMLFHVGWFAAVATDAWAFVDIDVIAGEAWAAPPAGPASRSAPTSSPLHAASSALPAPSPRRRERENPSRNRSGEAALNEA